MTFHYPRRVKDLPKLELDSDDDHLNTPRKFTNNANLRANNLEKIGNENKENNLASGTKIGNVFTNPGMYPKRRSELPALEPDSDSDDNTKESNLNCAILNDSFLLSPYKSEQDERNYSYDNKAQKATEPDTDNLSFISNFHKMALESGKKDIVHRSLPENVAVAGKSSIDHLPKFDEKINTAALRQTQSIDENYNSSNVPGTLQRTNSEPVAKKIDTETPLRPITNNAKINSAATNNAETQFATPQIRSFSMQRRPRDLGVSTQSQKTRSAIVNEFRSQKVLFQTPMAISRAPAISNDSLTLSLCDTIPECPDTPSSTEKTPRRSFNKEPLPAKSKKSLEGAFNEIDGENAQANVDNNQPESNSAIIPNCGVSQVVTTTTSSTTTNAKETMQHINNSDYAIIKKLGTGGSSSVYLARRKDNGKECALKVVDLRGDPVVVEGYLNETKLLAKLQGNVCVVSLYEYQLLQKESKLFLVMEKGDSDLHKILQTYTTNLPLYVLMNFLYQMIQAVNYIHQNGVIHSDLKPANFLMVNGRLKLIDFGIASNIAIDSTSIIKFSQAGTFNYISPEALTDTSTGTSPMRNNQPKIKISTKSDVWSLGCILYLLLYKKTPFSHIKNIYAKITAISSPTHVIEYPAIPPYYPEMLVHMVKSCLQHNPKQRPACADLLKYPFHMVIPIQNLSVGTK